MKRFGVLAVSMAVAISSSAAGYYSSSDASGWVTFLGILMMAWGILEIILFFKIWGMTNNVESITKKYVEPIKSKNAAITFFALKTTKGEDAAKAYLLDEVIKDLSAIDFSGNYAPEEYQKAIDTCKNKFQRLLDVAGVEFPDMAEYISVAAPTEMNGMKIGDNVVYEDYRNSTFKVLGFNGLTGIARLQDEYSHIYEYKVSKLSPKDVKN